LIKGREQVEKEEGSGHHRPVVLGSVHTRLYVVSWL
jgi:hypothetical protein